MHLQLTFCRPAGIHWNLNLQDGIQLIDAAYEVFIQGTAAEELKSYIFELRTKAMLFLEPARIREYMKIIADKDGQQTCQEVMEYIVVVLGHFLQIMVYICDTIFVCTPLRLRC